MYEGYYGMVHTPFARNVPPEALYESDAMMDVQGRLSYAADKQLFAVVTSDSGCGKSTAIRKFDASLPKEDFILLYLSDARLTPLWLYKGMLSQLGVEPKHFRIDAKRQFQREIEIIKGVQKKKIVCVLDEAHLLDRETIEEFRFLLNCRFDSESPLALILVGQTELWDEKLQLRKYAAVRDRIDLNCVIPRLDRAETEKYIRSHLAYAKGEQELFTSRAIDEVFRLSNGVMRVINRICEKALMYAYQQQYRIVDDHAISYVAEHEMLKGGEL